MNNLIIKTFVKNYEDINNPTVRASYGMVAGIFGIICNIILAAFKVTIGLLTGSFSIISDGINNISDICSSLVTLFGFKMSKKRADADHPFGHGRIEYVAGITVSIVIIMVGFELLRTSIGKIFMPDDLDFSIVAFIILVGSIGLKLLMGSFYTSTANKINSSALKASAADSFSDCISTGVVLGSTILYMTTGINIDGYASAAVAVFILITGINAVRETVHPLLGEKIPEEMVETVKKEVLEDKRILRIHDLIIHNYGEGRIYISLHAEINSDYSLIEAHEIIDDAERRVRNAFKCDITIHTDPVEIYDERYKELYKLVAGIIGQINVYNLANVSNTNKKDKENPMSYSMHDFHIHHSDKSKEELISFDLMVPEDFQGSPNKLKDYIKSEIRKLEPDLDVDIYVDRLYERIGF